MSNMKKGLSKRRPKTSHERILTYDIVSGGGKMETERPKTASILYPEAKNIGDLKRARSAVKSKSMQTVQKSVTFKLAESGTDSGEIEIKIEAFFPNGSFEDGTNEENLIGNFYQLILNKRHYILAKLNAHQNLEGITFLNLQKGSIVLRARCNSLRSLQSLENIYNSRNIVTVFHELFVKESKTFLELQPDNFDSLQLQVVISNQAIKLCKEQIIHRDFMAESLHLNQLPFDNGFKSRQDCVNILQKLQQEGTNALETITAKYKTFLKDNMVELFMVLKLTKPLEMKEFKKLSDVYSCKDYVTKSPSVGKSVNAQLIPMYLKHTEEIKDVNSKLYCTLAQWRKHIRKYVKATVINKAESSLERLFLYLEPELAFVQISADNESNHLINKSMSVMDKQMFGELAAYIPNLLSAFKNVTQKQEALLMELTFTIQNETETISEQKDDITSCSPVEKSEQALLQNYSKNQASSSIRHSLSESEIEECAPNQETQQPHSLLEMVDNDAPHVDMREVGVNASIQYDSSNDHSSHVEDTTDKCKINLKSINEVDKMQTSEKHSLENKENTGGIKNKTSKDATKYTPDELNVINKFNSDCRNKTSKEVVKYTPNVMNEHSYDGKNDVLYQTLSNRSSQMYFPRDTRMLNVKKILLKPNSKLLSYQKTAVPNIDSNVNFGKALQETDQSKHNAHSQATMSSFNKAESSTVKGNSLTYSMHTKHLVFNEDYCVRGPHYHSLGFRPSSASINRKFMLMQRNKTAMNSDNKKNTAQFTNSSKASLSSFSSYEMSSHNRKSNLMCKPSTASVDTQQLHMIQTTYKFVPRRPCNFSKMEQQNKTKLNSGCKFNSTSYADSHIHAVDNIADIKHQFRSNSVQSFTDHERKYKSSDLHSYSHIFPLSCSTTNIQDDNYKSHKSTSALSNRHTTYNNRDYAKPSDPSMFMYKLDPGCYSSLGRYESLGNNGRVTPVCSSYDWGTAD